MAEPIISFKKLNITFGENVVINNIDLDIRQGETLALLNGAAGSSLLHAADHDVADVCVSLAGTAQYTEAH